MSGKTIFYRSHLKSRHAWCHPELVSGSNRRGSSSTADPDLHQDDTVDDDFEICAEKKADPATFNY